MAKILIVDDVQSVRAICRRFCVGMGFQIFEAENGEIALDVVRQNPDLKIILLDWHMPLMDGLTFLRTLRADASLAQPRVVMCTSNTEIADVKRALEAGANEYLMKPFDDDLLWEKILEAGVVRRRSETRS